MIRYILQASSMIQKAMKIILWEIRGLYVIPEDGFVSLVLGRNI